MLGARTQVEGGQAAGAPGAVTLAAPVCLRLHDAPAVPERDYLRLGRYPREGERLGVNSRWLERDGRPWLVVMGEFQYSRYPQAEWSDELRRMAAGGVQIVASYAIWNHHEEVPGRFDWAGSLDLRRFVRSVQEAGLLFFLRPGPWVHAEVHLGGFPDWLVARGPVRCNHAAYLQQVRRWFGAIGEQLQGLMWRDGGPVIGVQLENEYDRTGPGCGAEHISELQRLAVEAGLQVPLYTVTGWPTLDIPPGDVIPVSGAYADGFWGGSTTAQPPSGVFLFNTSRAIGEMGNVGGTPSQGLIDKSHYPFFLAEAGGGMHVSYHRRPVVTADDVAATALVQLGSGANLYGYYVYHGGANPRRRSGPLHETQASGYPNDVPAINYDFRAPLGQYGQQRESFGRLRCLHQFIAAFGEALAPMEAVLGAGAPADPADRSRLRTAARGAGGEGFLFVNNHLRHHRLPDFEQVQFDVVAGARTIRLPHEPCTVPSGAHFIWPVGLRLGAAVIRHATVQPLTRWSEGDGQFFIAFAHPQIEPELCFDAEGVASIDGGAGMRRLEGPDAVRIHPGGGPAILHVQDRDGARHTVVLLPQALAEQCLRAHIRGRERLLMSRHLRYVQDDTAVLSVPHDERAQLQVFPADDLEGAGPAALFMTLDAGLVPVDLPQPELVVLHHEPRPPALRWGPHVGWRGGSVPLAPDAAAYDAATRVLLEVSADVPADEGRVMLGVDYVGDAARLHADGELVDDHFHDGETWWIGIDRFARDGAWPRFEMAILAADPHAPVFLEDTARQRLLDAPDRAAITGVRLQAWRTHAIELPACRG